MKNKNKLKEKPSRNIQEAINNFLDRHERLIFIIAMILSVLMSILMFDPKVSYSGDDSDYIVDAKGFWENFTYPGLRGALYPMFLAPFIGIFGMNLILLKALSAIFIVSSVWLLYRSFRSLVPPLVLAPTLILFSINSFVFFFASQTFSEPFYLLVQGLFFLCFSRYFLQERATPLQLKKDWRKYLIIGVLALAMTLTRSIGYGIVIGMALYFILRLQWKDLLLSLAAIAMIFFLYQTVLSLLYGTGMSATGGAYSIDFLLSKNPYDPNNGAETFAGLIDRIKNNADIYLSNYLCQYFGVIKERISNEFSISTFRTIIICALYFASLIIAFIKRNKALLFTGLYIGVMFFATFVVLQPTWGEDRKMMIYYSHTLLFLFGGLYLLFQLKELKKAFFIYPVILIIILIGTSINTKAKVGRNLPILQQNMLGNDLYGYTPDWENFVRMCRWANDKLEKDAVIVSRKPSISYIYTGRTFRGIYNVPSVNIADLVSEYDKTDKTDTLYFAIRTLTQFVPGISQYIQYIIVSKDNSSFTVNNQALNSIMICKLSKTRFDEVTSKVLQEQNINYSTDYENIIKQLTSLDQSQFKITSPDQLKDQLNGVKYLLLPKIRVYTGVRTEYFINTIHQYVTFIQLKYPQCFLLVHTIGKDETCELAEYVEPAEYIQP